jgi:hypothetical protein
MSANSRERLQQAIDAKIQSLEASDSESVRELKLRRNALSPISSLPPELFAAIFSFLCFPALQDGDRITHKHTRFDLSHVCHQWREMALNQPFLWSEVDFSRFSLACAREILARAKTVPLDLHARIPDWEDWNKVRFGAFQKQLQAHVPYAYRLSINAESLRLHKTLEGLVSPAPTLEYLSLISRGGYWKDTLARVSLHVSVPDTLFDGSAPRLFHLYLFRFAISWKSPLLKGLRHLEIHQPGLRPKLVAWLDALDEMSQLETLILLEASPKSPQDDIDHNTTLPSLTYLELKASPADCALALGHLDLPALTALSITVFLHLSDSFNDVQTLVPHLARHSYGPQDTQPLQSVLLRSERDTALMHAWSVTDIDVVVQDSPDSTFSATRFTPRMALLFITVNRYGTGHTRRDVLDAALLSLPLSSLDTLLVQEFKAPSEKNFWLRHAPKWPLIRRVQLQVSAHDGFKMMLLDRSNRERPLLPLLTELVLIGSTDDWIPALKKRTEQGVPLERLDLRMCYSREDVPLLREIVADVLGREDSPAGLTMRTIRRWEYLITTTFSQDDFLEEEYKIYDTSRTRRTTRMMSEHHDSTKNRLEDGDGDGDGEEAALGLESYYDEDESRSESADGKK